MKKTDEELCQEVMAALEAACRKRGLRDWHMVQIAVAVLASAACLHADSVTQAQDILKTRAIPLLEDGIRRNWGAVYEAVAEVQSRKNAQ
jgi:hypothetical protein